MAHTSEVLGDLEITNKPHVSQRMRLDMPAVRLSPISFLANLRQSLRRSTGRANDDGVKIEYDYRTTQHATY